jgi:hypothetical protein
MVDIGTGLAILGISAPIVVAAMKWIPQSESRYSKELCESLHRGIDCRLVRIENKVDTLIERGR